MSTGELLTRWTIRLALVCYFASLGCQLTAPAHGQAGRWARRLWTAGFAIFVVHVLCAFHFIHHWSHAAAFAETARRTREIVHWEFGYGVYGNHLFTLVWGLDVWRRWQAPVNGAGQQARWLTRDWLVQLFLAFIVFNGTIVFEPGTGRWLGMIGFTTLAVLLVRRAAIRGWLST
jgi:hypothetical protein